MFAIIGIVIVLGAIAAGYTMEHGNFKVLMQPAELVIIFGAAVGTVVIANPLPTLIKIGKGLAGVFGGSPFTKAFYLESLKMLYELFALSRKAGTAKLEEEVDNPSKGQVFNKYPKFVKNHHALHFLCDTLRMAVSGGVDPMEIDTMMEIDLDVHHTEAAKPIAALSTMADALRNVMAQALEAKARLSEVGSVADHSTVMLLRDVDEAERAIAATPEAMAMRDKVFQAITDYWNCLDRAGLINDERRNWRRASALHFIREMLPF